MTLDRNEYPTDGFFVGHKRFLTLKGRPWGDFLDGPVAEFEDVVARIIEHWSIEGFGPDRSDLRVWHIIPGKPAEDCTALAVRTVYEALEDQMQGQAQ